MSVRVIPPPPITPERGGDGGDGGGCPWAPRHLPVVVYTRRWRDLFRRRLWVRCWTCELKLGPYEVDAMASYERELLERS